MGSQRVEQREKKGSQRAKKFGTLGKLDNIRVQLNLLIGTEYFIVQYLTLPFTFHVLPPLFSALFDTQVRMQFQDKHLKNDISTVQLGAGSHRPDSVLHQKRPNVTLLKKSLLNASIISTLEPLSRDSKATNKLVIGW